MTVSTNIVFPGPGSIGVDGEHWSADVGLDLQDGEAYSGDTVAVLSLEVENGDGEAGADFQRPFHVDIELTEDDVINLTLALSEISLRVAESKRAGGS